MLQAHRSIEVNKSREWRLQVDKKKKAKKEAYILISPAFRALDGLNGVSRYYVGGKGCCKMSMLTELVSLILKLFLPVIIQNRLPDSIAITPTSSSLAAARLPAPCLCARRCTACCCCCSCCCRARLWLHTDTASRCCSSSRCSSSRLGCFCSLQ